LSRSPTRLRQKFLHRFDRPPSSPTSARRRSPPAPTIRANRLLPEPLRIPLARHDQSRRAIIRSRRITPPSPVPSFLNAGFQLRQHFHRSVFARRLVILHDHRVALFFCGTPIGKICASRKHDFRAREIAFW